MPSPGLTLARWLSIGSAGAPAVAHRSERTRDVGGCAPDARNGSSRSVDSYPEGWATGPIESRSFRLQKREHREYWAENSRASGAYKAEWRIPIFWQARGTDPPAPVSVKYLRSVSSSISPGRRSGSSSRSFRPESSTPYSSRFTAWGRSWRADSSLPALEYWSRRKSGWSRAVNVQGTFVPGRSALLRNRAESSRSNDAADEDKRVSLYRPREPRISPWIVWSGPSNGRSGWSQRDSPGSGRSNESATPEPVQKRHIPVRLLFAMAEIDLRRVAVKMQEIG